MRMLIIGLEARRSVVVPASCRSCGLCVGVASTTATCAQRLVLRCKHLSRVNGGYEERLMQWSAGTCRFNPSQTTTAECGAEFPITTALSRLVGLAGTLGSCTKAAGLRACLGGGSAHTPGSEDRTAGNDALGAHFFFVTTHCTTA